MAWVRLGTVNVANNSKTVQGIGTQWVGRALPGGIFVAPTGAVLEVDRIISDTELELMQPYPGPTVGNAAYAIAPTQAYLPALAAQLMQVLEQFGDIRTAWLSGQLKGEQGTGLAIRGEVASVGALPTMNALGDGWFVGSDLHIWTGAGWYNAGDVTGPAGPPNVLTIGTVVTGETGAPASATITGTAPAQQLNLVLPRGATGSVTPQLQALHDDAQTARDAAQGHASDATQAASAAADAKGQASAAASSAAQSATDAAGHKSAAQGAATAAAGYRSDAAASASVAAASEGQALVHAGAAETAAADAQTARDAAQGHAGAASSAAGAAQGHASAAAGSAGAASQAASEADARAVAAAQAADEADGRATAAAQSATAAAGHKSAAQSAATAAADAQAAAVGHANDADASASAAAASEGQALAHAEAAEMAAADAEAAAALSGISGITVDGQGHLILTRADNTQLDAGYVVGPAGAVGASIKVKPSVNTTGDLPPLNNDENDARVVRADGHLYVWDGESWTDAGQFQGPAGTTDYLQLSNRPTLGSAAALHVPAAAGAVADAAQVVRGDDPRLSDPRSPTTHTHTASQISDSTSTGRALMTAVDAQTARTVLGAGTSSFSGNYDDLDGKPAIPAAQVQPDWAAMTGMASILNKPEIPAAQVPADWAATEGASRILNKPTIPAAQEPADWSATEGASRILNKPTLGSAAGQDTGEFATAAQGEKADSALQPGSLKTINGEPLVGAGDITVSALTNVTYNDRGTLRNIESTHAVVEGLGLFVWTAGSDEPDDDESCFATSNGRWLLEAVHWDVVDAWRLPQDRSIIRSASVHSSLTSVSGTSQASFTAPVPGAVVGDAAFASPPNALGARIAIYAVVTTTDVVTVYVNNPSSLLQTFASGTWSITVIAGA